MNNDKSVQIISLESNIACGKSTLIDILKDVYKHNNDIVILQEPLCDWIDIIDDDGKNILELFYSDQKKYAFPFQMKILESYAKLLTNTINEYKGNDLTIIIERSHISCCHIFRKILYDNKMMNKVENDIFMNWFDIVDKKFIINKHIFIDTDFKECYKRIHIRNRIGEELIDIDYLKKLEKYHFDHFVIANKKCTLFLDGNENIFENDIKNNFIRKIDHFVFSSNVLNIDLRNYKKQMRSIFYDDPEYNVLLNEWDVDKPYSTYQM
jgi:deoxyadenosine/deoxycytidine kinase